MQRVAHQFHELAATISGLQLLEELFNEDLRVSVNDGIGGRHSTEESRRDKQQTGNSLTLRRYLQHVQRRNGNLGTQVGANLHRQCELHRQQTKRSRCLVGVEIQQRVSGVGARATLMDLSSGGSVLTWLRAMECVLPA